MSPEAKWEFGKTSALYRTKCFKSIVFRSLKPFRRVIMVSVLVNYFKKQANV